MGRYNRPWEAAGSGGGGLGADFGFGAGEESLDVFTVAEDDEQGNESGGDHEGPEIDVVPTGDGESPDG